MGPHSGPGSNSQPGPPYPSSWQDGAVEQHMSMLSMAESISGYDIRHTFDSTGLAGHLQSGHGEEDASGHRGSGATQQFSFLSGPRMYQSSEDVSGVAAMAGRDAGRQLEEQDAANAYFFREHPAATQQLLYSMNNFLPAGYSHQGGPGEGLGAGAGRGPQAEWADGVAGSNLDASRMLELQYQREQLGAGGSPPQGDADPGGAGGFRFGEQYSQEAEASGHGGDGSGAFRGYEGSHNGGAQLHAPAGNDNYDDDLASQAYRISLLQQQQQEDHSQLPKTHVSATCEMPLAMQQQGGDHGSETVHTPGSLLFASQQQQEAEGLAMGNADSRASGWNNLWLFNGNGAGASFYNGVGGQASYDSVQELSAFGSSNVNSVPASSAAAAGLGSGSGSLHAQGFSSDTAMQLYLSAYNGQGFADASGGVSDLMVASGSGGAGNPDFGIGGNGSGSQGQGHGGSQPSYLNLPLQASAMGQGNAGLGMQVQHLSSLDDTASQHLSLATNMQLGQGASPFSYTTSSGSWRHENTELTFLPSSESAQESSQCFPSVAEQLSHYEVLQRSRAQGQQQQHSAFQGRLSMADSDAVQGSGQGLSLSLFSQQQQQQSNVQGGRSSLDAPGQLAAVGPADVMSLAAAAEARLSLHDHAGPSNSGVNPSLSRFRTPAPPPAREPFPVLRHIVHNSSGPQQVYRQVDVEAAPLGRLLTLRGTYARAGRELLHEICSPCTARLRAHRRAPAQQREQPSAAALQPTVVQPAAPQAAIVEGGAVGDSVAEGGAKVQQGESSNGPAPAPQPPVLTPEQRSQIEAKKARLTGMMEEVDGTYRGYSEQMRVVITTMDVALGKGAAQSYTNLAFEAMSRHFRGLRDTIEGQLRVCNRLLGEEDAPNLTLTRGEIPRLRFVDQQLRQQRALQHLGMLQQHAWRPQRGLPERAVTVLRAWLFEHFLHPYPKDGDKMSLARQTGLTRSQVSNWFINARVRLWKPMVEEMYLEESKEEEAAQQRAAALALEEAPAAPEDESPMEETPASGSEGPAGQDEDARASKKARNGPAPGLEVVSGSGSAIPSLGPFHGLSRFGPGGSSRFGSVGASGGSGSVVSLTLGLRHSDSVPGSRQSYQLAGLELVAGGAAEDPSNAAGTSFMG